MNDEITQTQEIDTESPEELERKRERRKGIRSFFEFQIIVSVIATAVLTLFSVFPFPKEMLDRKITLFFYDGADRILSGNKHSRLITVGFRNEQKVKQ